MIEGIKNLIKWAPIIWKDRDWDYGFLLTIMIFKMTNLEKEISKADRHIDTQKDMKSLRICIELLKRIQEDNYYGKELEELYKDVDWTDLNKNRSPEWEKKAAILCKKTQRAYKEDADMLFKLFRKNFNKWWD